MRKILVIDDEKPTLKMFRLFLNAYGYEVFIAEDGQTGLEIYKKESPEIVFTDIKMPGMDGIEVLRKIKEINPLTEVIVVTGHGDMDLAIQALNLGATDFINKPIGKIALDSALGRAEERIKLSGIQENEILFQNRDNLTIIDIKGNITSISEPLLSDAFKNASEYDTSNILLRFDEISSVNGAGIAILIKLLSASKKKNKVVAITGISENFKQIFEMAGITKFVKIFDKQEDAIKYLTVKGVEAGKL
ncbi:MAG: response regulator [Deltaproteobacteria bacterium]|nr:response regulator [Deltaproteobacteria bacterium]